MKLLVLRIGLLSLFAYGALILKTNHAVDAQSCGSCRDDCTQEDAGDNCTNDYGTDCTWQGPTDYCRYSSGCPDGDDVYGNCCVSVHSPLVIDTEGAGFHLTSGTDGVFFAITNTLIRYETAWTLANAHNSWLVLDRDGNGYIDNGAEMFGNYTAQPTPPPGGHRNGFAALAVFDQRENGGNGDGVIDAQDAIYRKLRLWDDANHNGVSEANELHTLQSEGVAAIELHYTLSRKADTYGNQFRYRGRVLRDHGADDGRFAWDVILVGPTSGK